MQIYPFNWTLPLGSCVKQKAIKLDSLITACTTVCVNKYAILSKFKFVLIVIEPYIAFL